MGFNKQPERLLRCLCRFENRSDSLFNVFKYTQAAIKKIKRYTLMSCAPLKIEDGGNKCRNQCNTRPYSTPHNALAFGGASRRVDVAAAEALDQAMASLP